MLAPRAMASAPEAHAETGAWAPAWAPSRTETFAAGAFGMSIGTVNGRARRAPRSRTVSQALSVVLRPPMPEENTAPSRSRSTPGLPASAHACSAAITAYWEEGSIRLTSRTGSTVAAGTARRAANPTGRSQRSCQSSSSACTPGVPARAAAQVEVTSPPSGLVVPSPVMATLRAIQPSNAPAM